MTYLVYSDDPVVCNDGPEISAHFCTHFQGYVQARCRISDAVCPDYKTFVDLGKGMPLAAPTNGIAYNPP